MLAKAGVGKPALAGITQKVSDSGNKAIPGGKQ